MEPSKYAVDCSDLMRHRNNRLAVAADSAAPTPLTAVARNTSARASRSDRLFMSGKSDVRRPALQAGAASGNLGAPRRRMRWLKFCIAIWLLPACMAATLTAWQLGHALLSGAPTTTALAFGAGYAMWLVVFAFLPKPM